MAEEEHHMNELKEEEEVPKQLRCRTCNNVLPEDTPGISSTVFENFLCFCEKMHREADHVMAFLLAKLGRSGFLEDQQRLVVAGSFDSQDFEAILLHYINEYLICHDCKSPDTVLCQENQRLRCDQCGTERGVAPIEAAEVE